MKVFLLGLFLSTNALAQTAIPSGTVLPLELRSSLNSHKSKPGQTITGRIMQDVPLSPQRKIPAGAKVVGQVVNVQPAQAGHGTEMMVRFDSIHFSHRIIPITTSLRALASLMEVEDAQVPPTGADRGTPWAWSTRTLVGGEVAYGEGGPVARGNEVVGHALFNGVLASVRANRSSGCRGEVGRNTGPQALWVFSSDACGVYGFPDVKIAHAGRTAPEGAIVLISGSGKLVIGSGSGLLLRVNDRNQESPDRPPGRESPLQGPVSDKRGFGWFQKPELSRPWF